MSKTSKLKALIVDDEPISIRALAKLLEEHASSIAQASSGSEALDRMEKEPFDLVITDLVMPGMDGFGLVKRIRTLYPDVMVFIFTGHDSFSLARKALELGADAYLLKPLDRDQLTIAVHQALEKKQLHQKIAQLGQLVETQWSKSQIVGQSRGVRDMHYLIEKARHSQAPVLIQGESGTGKELVARAICGTEPVDLEKFVSINCCAISEGLIESELFGHVRGAFSGAVADRRGLFELADGGTLFLDEIGDITPALQMKLLRVLQEKEVRRVGDNQTRLVNVRIIAATNKDLKAAIADGSFREDLYYRLNVIPIHLPPLRERRDDIPLLAEHFVVKYQDAQNSRRLSSDAHKALQSYDYPGNIRELENIIQRALSLSSNQELLGTDFTPYFQEEYAHSSNVSHTNATLLPIFPLHKQSRQNGVGDNTQILSNNHVQNDDKTEKDVHSDAVLDSLSVVMDMPVANYDELKYILTQWEKNWIEQKLKEAGGRVQDAARLMGIGRTALHNKISKLLIDVEALRNHVSG